MGTILQLPSSTPPDGFVRLGPARQTLFAQEPGFPCKMGGLRETVSWSS